MSNKHGQSTLDLLPMGAPRPRSFSARNNKKRKLTEAYNERHPNKRYKTNSIDYSLQILMQSIDEIGEDMKYHSYSFETHNMLNRISTKIKNIKEQYISTQGDLSMSGLSNINNSARSETVNANNILNGLFSAHFVIHKEDKRFGEKGRGRKIHSVQYKADETLFENAVILQNDDGLFYCTGIDISAYVLSHNEMISVRIFMRNDESVHGESAKFRIPQCAKKRQIDNGIFCCCGCIYDKESEYESKKKKKSKKLQTFLSSFICVISNCNRVKIESIKPEIVNGKLNISWIVDGDFALTTTISDDDDDDDERNGVNEPCEWIRCSRCMTWQHYVCIAAQHPYVMGETNVYKCSLLCSNATDISLESTNLKSEFDRIKTVIFLIGELGGYRRKKEVKYGGNEELYKDCDVSQLIEIALKRGINVSDKWGKSELINQVVNYPIFTQTHPDLAYFLASIGKQQSPKATRIAEFGAGNGNITKCIAELHPNANIIDAYEIDKDRVCAGKQRNLGNINWIIGDILNERNMKKMLKKEKYDLIEFNPKFEIGFECIYLALNMLKDNGSIIALLPDDFFEGTNGRLRLANILPFRAIKRYFVGRWTYYPVFDANANVMSSQCKVTSDSIWVLKKLGDKDTMRGKFDYRPYHPLLDNTLKNK